MFARESLRRGTIKKEEYEDLVERKIEKIIRFQEECGIDYYNSGSYSWDDIFSPFFEGGLSGVERDGLIRFFDNNTYYRRPIIVGRLEYLRSSTKPTIEAALKHAANPKRLKAFMPGPYTFASLSENSFYPSMEALLRDVSEVLKAELEELLKTGVGYVEVHDPSLGWLDQKTAETLYTYYRGFVGESGEKVWFTIPFRPPNPHAVKMLSRLGEVVVSLDLSSTTLHGGANVNDSPGWASSAVAILRELSKLLGGLRVDLGLVDARNTLLEPLDFARQIVAEAFRARPKQLYLSNNATFDFLPESVAFEKVKILGRLKGEVGSLG